MTLRRGSAAVVALVGVLAAGLVLWLLSSPSANAPAQPSVREARAARVLPSPGPPELMEPPKAVHAPALVSARARSDEHNVVGPGPNDPHEPGMHPHPITPEHLRIEAENQLIQKLNDAMSVRNAGAMRELLVDYTKLDPGDVDATQAGYAIIADCIEFPGEASLAEAREFYATQRHSPLRRFVRRICFQNGN